MVLKIGSPIRPVQTQTRCLCDFRELSLETPASRPPPQGLLPSVELRYQLHRLVVRPSSSFNNRTSFLELGVSPWSLSAPSHSGTTVFVWSWCLKFPKPTNPSFFLELGVLEFALHLLAAVSSNPPPSCSSSSLRLRCASAPMLKLLRSQNEGLQFY
ncbi:uncharacterized protein DS421_18g604020 [Arachis hypogaea]|nr:uncharacterized protein DS421_18g604020 [Arachis hypogaea]